MQQGIRCEAGGSSRRYRAILRYTRVPLTHDTNELHVIPVSSIFMQMKPLARVAFLRVPQLDGALVVVGAGLVGLLAI